MNRPAGRRRQAPRPVADRLCDLVCLVGAGWTLCTHAVVACEGSLSDLLAVAGVLIVVAVGTLFVVQKRAGRADGPATCTFPIDSGPGPLGAGLGPRLVGVAAGIAATVTYLVTGRSDLLWWISVPTLLLGTVFVINGASAPLDSGMRSDPEAAPTARSREALLWGLALACVLIALIAHRPDADDANYVFMAVSAVDAPDDPLLRANMFGRETARPLHAYYRIHSYEPFHAALSFMTGIPAIASFHLLGAALLALLAPLAFARLFRVLTPTCWLWSVAVLILVLLGASNIHRWYGNFAFVRLWQGKAAFLTCFVPLTCAYGFAFGAAPTWRRWLLLAAVQVTSVGLTAVALWAVPVIACVAMLASIPLNRRGLLTLAVGLLASGYVVFIGLQLMSEMGGPASGAAGGMAQAVPILRQSLARILGRGIPAALAITCMLATWALWRRGAAMRFAAIVPLATLATIANPYLQEIVAANALGPGATHWRLLWAMPIPILMTLAIVAPLQLDATVARRRAGRGSVVLIMLVLLVASFRSGTLSASNGTQLGWPGLKVHPEYAVAQRLNALVPASTNVVAPTLVCLWIPMEHDHPYPVISRLMYGPAFRQLFTPAEIAQRLLMAGMVSSADDVSETSVSVAALSGRISGQRNLEDFGAGLEDLEVSGVCLNTHAPRAKEVRSVLEEHGFALEERAGDYEFWIRTQRDPFPR